MNKSIAITGAEAAAEAMRQINPDVVAMYPITPQTPIVQGFAEFVADGIVDTEVIRVESEHSAMSACVGASAAGARAMTASSSAGIALMWEILGIASGLRLPIVMSVANRALSGPLNIHCDHSDAMGCRDHSWIMIFSENAQEVYEHTLLAVRLAEHKDVMLPVMVNQDGFVTSHGVENVTLLNDDIAKKFIKEYKPTRPLLDIKNPVTVGPFLLPDYLFEFKKHQAEAMEKSKKVFIELGRELSKITKNDYGFFEKYKMDDAKAVIVTMNSTAGTTKAVIDKMRKQGKKVGLLKIRLFRPFPYTEIANALKNINAIGVLDRAESYGAYAPLYSEIRNSLFDLSKRPKMQSYVFGLGGRDIFESDIEGVFNELLSVKVSNSIKYIGCR